MAGYYLINFDKPEIHRKINSLVGYPFFDFFYKYITHLGDGVFAVLVGAAILFVNIRNGLYILIAYAVSGLISSLLKNVFFDNVNRPQYVFNWDLHEKINYVDGVDILIHNSFPSGHATTAFALFTCLALISKSNFLKILFLIIALNVAFSRTYISQHWLADIYFGSLLGVISSSLLYILFISRKFQPSLNRPLIKKSK